jgi:hypothetical protein
VKIGVAAYLVIASGEQHDRPQTVPAVGNVVLKGGRKA